MAEVAITLEQTNFNYSIGMSELQGDREPVVGFRPDTLGVYHAHPAKIVHAAIYKPTDPGADVTPPTIDSWFPASGATLLSTDTIHVQLIDLGSGIESDFVWAVFDDGSTELIATNGVAEPAYSTTVVTPLPPGRSYTIARDAGWRSASFVIHAQATDSAGNKSTSTASYLCSNPVVPGGTTTTYYIMRGIDPDCGQLTYRYWKVSGSEDWTGAEYADTRCGGSPLTDISVVRTWIE